MNIYDFLIVGSGASGSSMAYYLTRSGAKVLLLEAGKYHHASNFPTTELQANTQMYWHGGMDPNKDASLVFLRGKTLGGGTVINQALLDRFDDLIFDEWNEKSRLNLFSESKLDRYYREVESHFQLHTVEKPEWNRNAELYCEMFEKNGYRWGQLRRGQSQCATEKGNDCITCLGGCRRDSKQSMLVTYLPKAIDQGLDIRTEFSVQRLIHRRDRVEVHGEEKGVARVIVGHKVIVASGALGTSELMLRSGFQDRLPALGHGIHCHPQWMNMAFFDEIVDAHKGTLQSLSSVDDRFRRHGFKLENVFAGPIAIAMLKNAHGRELQHYMQRYRHMASLEVCIKDASSGRVYLNRAGRFVIDRPLTAADRQRGAAGVKVANELYRSIGAKEVVNSNFNFSLHVQGGCAIGFDASHSVVNENHQVHGLENLYVADISTFPAPPGKNPMLTVMALSHRASEAILAEFGVRNTQHEPLSRKMEPQ